MVLWRADISIDVLGGVLSIAGCLLHPAHVIYVDINGFVQIILILMQFDILLLQRFDFVAATVVQVLVVLKRLQLVCDRCFWMLRLLWLQRFDLFELALLQIVQQNLFLIRFTHRSELRQLIHLKDAKSLLVIELLLLHGLQLLYVLQILQLLRLVLVHREHALLVPCTFPLHKIKKSLWLLLPHVLPEFLFLLESLQLVHFLILYILKFDVLTSLQDFEQIQPLRW